MTESWVTKPQLSRRCKVRIFKSRGGGVFPWILVLPAAPTVESKRRAVGYPNWRTAWSIAMLIQDERNDPL